MARQVDVAILGDLRFPGGTSAAIAAEIDAQFSAGYRTALIALKAPVLRFPHPIHPLLRAHLDAGRADLVDAEAVVEAGLALVHHPQVLTHLPRGRLRLQAEQHLLVAHHPPFDADGQPFYDWQRIDHHAAALFGRPITWAPVGPLVRRQLRDLGLAGGLWPEDWHNVLDPAAWMIERAPIGDTLVVGRHSRPDLLKWPATREEALLVYPTTPEFEVRVLGTDPAIARFLAPVPENWRLLPFGSMDVRAFLGSLDAYLFYHHPRWVEAFGRTLLEAMATGLPVVLPRHFRELFRDAAIYADPLEAVDVLHRLRDDPTRRQEQGDAARQIVAERFSSARHVERLRAIVGAPAAVPRSRPRRLRTVLFFTSNGVGLGHVTRALAIAKRCPPELEPVFVTLSQSAGLIEDAGFSVEYLPFHAYLGADTNRWNHYLANELAEIARYHDPRVILFDGNTPYSGLVRAMHGADRAWAVWVRRGFWRAGSGAAALERESAFDAVVEPEDLADIVDQGPTTRHLGRTVRVPPVRLLDGAELLSREEARHELELPPDGPCFLVQLGAGNNFDFGPVQERVLERLGEVPGATVAVLASPISHGPMPAEDAPRILRVFPSSRYLRAFDGVVSAVGYNSFHELILAGAPTLFVPNEHPMMDDQAARAEHAQRMGWSLALRAGDVYGLDEQVDRLLDPDECQAMRRAMALLPQRNGAADAARILTEMAYTLRADRGG